MLNTHVIFADLPPKVKGMLVRTFDEEECYTVVINSRLNYEQQVKAYEHEVQHMNAKDFDQVEKDVDQIEMVRHKAI